MPSIINGLFAGRAGIQSHGTAIGVLADNIANSNTTGFKASRAEFSDLIAGNISGGGSGVTIGSGSNVNRVTSVYNQGTFEFTGRALDLAIDGNGFFILRGTGGERFYSRAGNMKVGADGTLLNQNGYAVLGFPENGSGALEALNVNNRTTSTAATTSAQLGGNLNAAADVLAGGAADIPDSTNPATTFADLSNAADFSTFLNVYDSLGAAHAVTVYFFHTAAGAWTANAYVDGGDITGETASHPYLIGGAAMTFDGSGALTADATINATATWNNGATASTFPIALSPFSQFAAPSSVDTVTQNGSSGGSVVSFQVGEDGTVAALLDNGQRTNIGQIALASFANPEGLTRKSGTTLVETSTSGSPIVGTAKTGRFGGIQVEALELSTSDMASDFIKLISYQRGFQGSSRMISSINDLMNEIVNII